MKRGTRDLILEFTTYGIMIVFMAAFWRNNLLTFALLLLVWLTAIRFWHSKKDVIFFAAAAILGSLAEIICIWFGAWLYANPNMINIPVWLPLAWGCAGVLIRRFSMTVSAWMGWK